MLRLPYIHVDMLLESYRVRVSSQVYVRSQCRSTKRNLLYMSYWSQDGSQECVNVLCFESIELVQKGELMYMSL